MEKSSAVFKKLDADDGRILKAQQSIHDALKCYSADTYMQRICVNILCSTYIQIQFTHNRPG